MNDTISRQAAIQKMRDLYNEDMDAYGVEIPEMFDCDRAIEALQKLPFAEPETSRIVIGMSKCGVTMWHECELCHQPVDLQDAYCRGCGRRFVHE